MSKVSYKEMVGSKQLISFFSDNENNSEEE